MSDRFRELWEDFERYGFATPLTPERAETIKAALTAAEERDGLETSLERCVKDIGALKKELATLEAASRQLWDKDDALTKLHRRISELEAALAESRKKVEELEDRLNDIHIHNLERD